MKLKSIASEIIVRKNYKLLTESAEGDANKVQKQLADLTNALQADGEDITDEEVQAAMLSALVDADGNLDDIDVSDVEAIKTEIKEGRGYITESGSLIMQILEGINIAIGNAAFIHALAEGIHKITGVDVDEKQLKAKLEKIFKKIKNVTGWPAEKMEQAFTWLAKKAGAGEQGQKIAGLSGTLITVIAMFALGIYLFPSITSGILIVLAIVGFAGKSAEIFKLGKELYHHIKDAITGKGDYSRLDVDTSPAGA